MGRLAGVRTRQGRGLENEVKHCVSLVGSRILIPLGVRMQDDKSHSVRRGEVEVVNYSSGASCPLASAEP